MHKEIIIACILIGKVFGSAPTQSFADSIYKANMSSCPELKQKTIVIPKERGQAIEHIKDSVSVIYVYSDSTMLCLEFNNGKENGIETSLDKNGKVVTRIAYENGIISGEAQSFYPNGNLKSQGLSVAGKLDGELRMFYESGALSGIRNYTKGMLNGRYVDYYENSRIKIEATLKNNKLVNNEGVYYELNKTVIGEKYRKYYFKSSFEDGLCTISLSEDRVNWDIAYKGLAKDNIMACGRL